MRDDADEAPLEDAEGPADVQRARYRELLAELRTIMPGVQVLFGFLLVAPFSERFGELDRVGVWAFLLALVATALATVVFGTPTAYHRVGGSRDRERRIAISARAQLVGMALLAFAMADSVFVVTRFLMGTGLGMSVGGLVLVAALGTWVLLPRRRPDGSERGDPEAPLPSA